MASEYKTLLKINEDAAMEMAKLTKGYAYQLLGYLCWSKKTEYRNETIEGAIDMAASGGTVLLMGNPFGDIFMRDKTESYVKIMVDL